MWKETETGKVRFWRLWSVSEVNSKPANPFETKGNLAAGLATVGVREGELAERMVFEARVRSVFPLNIKSTGSSAYYCARLQRLFLRNWHQHES